MKLKLMLSLLVTLAALTIGTGTAKADAVVPCPAPLLHRCQFDGSDCSGHQPWDGELDCISGDNYWFGSLPPCMGSDLSWWLIYVNDLGMDPNAINSIFGCRGN